MDRGHPSRFYTPKERNTDLSIFHTNGTPRVSASHKKVNFNLSAPPNSRSNMSHHNSNDGLSSFQNNDTSKKMSPPQLSADINQSVNSSSYDGQSSSLSHKDNLPQKNQLRSILSPISKYDINPTDVFPADIVPRGNLSEDDNSYNDMSHRHLPTNLPDYNLNQQTVANNVNDMSNRHLPASMPDHNLNRHVVTNETNENIRHIVNTNIVV